MIRTQGLRSRSMCVAVLLSAASGGCSQSDSGTEPEPWTIAPSPNTMIYDYGAQEGEARIGLEQDLIIGREGPPEEQLNLPADIAVDDAGRIYVLDSRDYEVLVFGPEGRLVMSLGGRGAGPGELGRASQLAVTHDRVFVQDMQNRRITTWDLEGSYLGHTPLRPGGWYEEMHGIGDGRIIAVQPHRSSDGTTVKRFVVLDQDAQEIEERFQLAPRHKVKLRSNVDEPYLEGLVSSVNDRTQPTPAVAVHRSGSVYITDAVAYQVHAHGPAGQPRWALRSLLRAKPFPEEEVDRVISIATKRVPLRRSWIEWPDRLPAIARIATDGEGRLFVFPFHYFDPQDQPAEVPVHVYADSGEYLLAGSIPPVAWSVALGDYVYGKRLGPESNEWEVVRWRIELPPITSRPRLARNSPR